MKHEAALIVSHKDALQALWKQRLADHQLSAEGVHTMEAAHLRLSFQSATRLVFLDASLAARDGFLALRSLSLLDCRPCIVALLDTTHNIATVDFFRNGAADVLPPSSSDEELQASLTRVQSRIDEVRACFAYRNRLERLVSERNEQLTRMMADLERSYDITIEAMGDALDLRDEETEGHSKRVTAYTVALARHMKLSGPLLQTVARGALLHDIGKIAIPDSILLKPGRLTQEEMHVMQRHCEHGYAIVRKIPFLSEAAEIVYAHQERYDGKGYPRGLAGDQIPLGARIFALADTLDAMTSDRPYRRGVPFAAAVREIAASRGAQFDPRIVDSFLAMPRAIWPAIRAEVGRHSHAGELVRLAAAA